MPQLTEFLQSIQLPTMPEVAHELIRSLNDDDAPIAQVRDAIAKDPALTVKLMRLANSSRYGASRAISSVDDAISRVGSSQVRTLALASCMNNAFPVAPGLDRQVFWHTSHLCAGYSRWLAHSLGADAEQAWLAGFMLRLGELLIAQYQPGCLTEIERQPQQPGVRWQREESLLGFNEGQVTAEVARRWNFPEAIVRALDAAANPTAFRPFSRLGAVLHLGELLSEQEKVDASTVNALPAEVLEALLLDKTWLQEHLPAARVQVEELAAH